MATTTRRATEDDLLHAPAGSLPRVSTLEKLADAHGMTLDDYVAAVSRIGRHERGRR